MSEKKIRLTGIQAGRAIDAAGGLFTMRGIDNVCGMRWGWVSRERKNPKRDPPFPRPATWYGVAANSPLFSGDDVIDYLEDHEMYGRAEKMIVQVNKIRLKYRREIVKN